MKIDLHCHTREIVSGDKGREITAKNFVQIMVNSNVAIAAITNHNYFDLQQYNEIIELSNNEHLQVWPGVELDVNGNKSGNNRHGHITIVTDQENAETLARVMSNLQIEDPNKFVIEIDRVINSFKPLKRYIIACHYLKKPSLELEDIRYLTDNVDDNSVVVMEPTDMRKAGIIANSKGNCWFGSDVKNWNEYSSENLPELSFDIDNFNAFLDLLKNKQDAVLLHSYLDRKQPISIEIDPYQDLHLKLSLYKDINVIFGQKATGKTDILRSIKDKLIEKNLNVSSFFIEDKASDILQIVDYQPQDSDFADMSYYFCEKQLNQLQKWKAHKVTTLKEYKNYFEYTKKRTLLEHLKISKSVYQSSSSEDVLSIKKEELLKNLNSISKVLELNKAELLSDNENAELKRLLKKIRGVLIDRYINLFANSKADDLTEFTVKTIKQKLAAKQGVIPRPDGTGLKTVFNEYSALYKAVHDIQLGLQAEKKLPPEVIGRLSAKGTLKRTTFIGIKDQTSSKNKEWTKRNYLDKSATQSQYQKFCKIISGLGKHILDEEQSTYIEKLQEFLNETNISTLKHFLNYSNLLSTDYSNDYKPSNGEQSILLVQNVLIHDDCDAVLLDEAESGMGADYINDELVPEIKSKAAHNKIVVIVTHDPNIVVRTHPFSCIYREEVGNGKYKTFIGSSFEENMTNVNDPNDKIRWIDACLKICEGGSKAFIERGITYGEYGFYY